ncbi:MAG: PriCT-2 domain-containing protein, partial [Eggerthellaceae bacterium]|nr:PriCT-2 domain-containing protein [Eggerthellaceae bacterium]
MTERRYDLVDALASIPPDVHYDDFITVGQALHHEGYGIDVWRSWASGCNADHKKRLPELDKHWRSFASGNAANPVTGGSLVKLARDHGWAPASERAVEYADYDGWSVSFGDDDEPHKVVDADAVSEYDARVEPMFPEGHESEELAAYLRALFDEGDVIRYVIDATYDAENGRAKPGVGVYKRTAGDVLKLLDAGKSIEDALGTLDAEVGAYICINPLDGNYIGNKNVTDCRFALLESDEMPIGQFAAIVRDMNIPVAAMVYSGNKSLHAIVRVGAKDLEQYRSRVEVLYKRAADNGIIVDKANKNASRMSRLPGVMRGGKRQFLAGLSQGAGDWDEWEEWYAEATDDLPDAVSLASALEDLPPLKPALIDGMLRVGHKMLLSGPSKAGKSFALIALCIELARGGSWLGFTCRKSHVMYVNLELDGDSCLN